MIPVIETTMSRIEIYSRSYSFRAEVAKVIVLFVFNRTVNR